MKLKPSILRSMRSICSTDDVSTPYMVGVPYMFGTPYMVRLFQSDSVDTVERCYIHESQDFTYVVQHDLLNPGAKWRFDLSYHHRDPSIVLNVINIYMDSLELLE